MNENLNRGKLKYDSPKYGEMYVFLNHLLTIVKSNPNINLTHGIVYNELKKFTLTSKDLERSGIEKNNRHLFSKWINNFQHTENIYVFNDEKWSYWCQFINKSFTDDFIKIYIPLDSEGLEECVNDIFNFLAKHDISHQSKVASDLRNDNVVIRLDKGDEKSLKMLIDYINNNMRIRQHLNKVNPFLPSINGIGVMNETGISYNSELTDLIKEYINNNRHLSKINVEDFISYIKEKIDRKEVYQAFMHATSDTPQYFDAYEDIQGMVSKKDEISLTQLQKQALLNDCIKATYEKYGMHQVLVALSGVINRATYKYFTNGTSGYRDKLKLNIKPEEIKEIILKTMSQITYADYSNISDAIKDYCNYFLQDNMIKKLDEMCQVTLDNYDKDYLAQAIMTYCAYNHISAFSRYKKDDLGEKRKNYRENCRFFTPESMIQTMRKSLNIRGIPTENIKDSELAYHYSNVLSNSNYLGKLKEDDIKNYR